MFDPDATSWDATFFIRGEAASKNNSRRLVTGYDGVTRSIKSAKAMEFVDAIKQQCQPLDQLLTGPLMIWSDCFYRSRRPDLDTTLVEDGLEGIAYANDRQIVMNISRKFINRPPCVIVRIKRVDFTMRKPDLPRMVEKPEPSNYKRPKLDPPDEPLF